MRKSNHFKGLVIATALLFAGFGVRAQQLETSVFLNGILPVAQFNNEVNLEPLGTFEPMTSENIAKGAAGLSILFEIREKGTLSRPDFFGTTPVHTSAISMTTTSATTCCSSVPKPRNISICPSCWV